MIHPNLHPDDGEPDRSHVTPANRIIGWVAVLVLGIIGGTSIWWAIGRKLMEIFFKP
jgi:hypothetical protein